MTKPRPINGLTSDQPFCASAGTVFSVRIEELWDLAQHLPFEERVRELHDMRIAAKRLRYGIEFYEPCFNRDMTDVLEEFKRLQDLLGEVHDYDVWQVMLRERLARGEVLAQLLEALADIRSERYEELVGYWEELQQQGFREQLAAAVSDVGPGRRD